MTRGRACSVAIRALVALLGLGFQIQSVEASATAFTYQGQLQQNGGSVNGTYNFQFALYAASSGGSPIAALVTNNNVNVTNGLFTVTLDFGSAPFTGSSNWVQIGVETNTGGAFTTLMPRLFLSPVPNAIYAETVNPAGVSNVNITTATGLLPVSTLPTVVITNGASGVSVGYFTATNYGYVTKWVTNSYLMTTNDTVLFCWGTNELLTLPVNPPMGKMFTVFSKNPNGSVILTNGTGSQLITVPGLGQAAAVLLGASTSASNVITVTFDGSNY